jgi:hypothetical protein
MLKIFFLTVTLFISSTVFSQTRHRRYFRIEGYSVKTDVLSLFGSVLDKESKSGYLSGEMYFNDEYSFSVHLGAESESRPGVKYIEKRIGSQLRWYFWQDDCSCSALFVGSYFSASNGRQSVDQKLLNNNAISYTTSTLEAGFSGGYQALIARHFVLDPAVQIGMKFPHRIHNTETLSSIRSVKDKGLLLRITLGIGYRF